MPNPLSKLTCLLFRNKLEMSELMCTFTSDLLKMRCPECFWLPASTLWVLNSSPLWMLILFSYRMLIYAFFRRLGTNSITLLFCLSFFGELGSRNSSEEIFILDDFTFLRLENLVSNSSRHSKIFWCSWVNMSLPRSSPLSLSEPPSLN